MFVKHTVGKIDITKMKSLAHFQHCQQKVVYAIGIGKCLGLRVSGVELHLHSSRNVLV